MYHSWRTEETGLIVVMREDWTEFTPTLTKPGYIAKVEYTRTRWGALFDRKAHEFGLGMFVLDAHAVQESGGDPFARNREGTPSDPSDDGIGLFQITYPGLKGRRQIVLEDGKKKWIGGHTDQELFDPELNTSIAARHLKGLYGIYGDDFPKCSAAFNAGSVRKPNPGYENDWNMHFTPGHVQFEVSAYNFLILQNMEEIRRIAAATQFPLHDLLNSDDDEAPETPRNA